MVKKSLFLILLLFIPGLLFLNYIGVFTKTVFKEQMTGPYSLVYKEHLGEYKYAGNTIHEVGALLVKNGIKDGTNFGLFYDDPKKTKKENLRCDAGILFKTALKIKLPEGLKWKEFPLQNCLIIEYPNKNFLSVYTGIAKVYPKLFKYAAEKGFKKAPVMEVYEANKIVYVMPLGK
jgi:DNA gyrase inhibitor GyrI